MTEMHVAPQRAKTLTNNLSSILSRVQSASKAAPQQKKVRLIAVSKLKPASDVLALHRPPPSSSSPPHIHFGENYSQELQEKAKLLPKSIRWHFIGALQTNKCKGLAKEVANLECVSSVDSEKKATELEKGRKAAREEWEERKGGKGGEQSAAEKSEGAQEEEDVEPAPLGVHVQVNTSGEESKSGVAPSDAAKLCSYIRDSCPHLQLRGLMTIGAIARSQATTAETENEDFVCLRETRDKIAKELGLKEDDMELSMGMSADFEAAIKQGADVVRVGSDIFGKRPKRQDFKVKEDVAEEKN